MASDPPSSAQPSAPVTEAQRIAMIDVLRGVAILGVLISNVRFFAFPWLEVSEWSWRDTSTADALARSAIQILADFNIATVFALLFGIGLALQSSRAQRSGRPFVGMYCRRLIFLLIIGLLHGVFLWFGDILALFAMVGFVVLALRNARDWILLFLACLVFITPLGLNACGTAADPYGSLMPSTWSAMGDHFEGMIRATKEEARARTSPAATSRPAPATSQPASGPSSPLAATPASSAPTGATTQPTPPVDEETEQVIKRVRIIFDWVADEPRIFREGSFWEIARLRTAFFLVGGSVSAITSFGWRTLAMMLLGVYWVRRGVFDDPARHRSMFQRWFKWGLLLGLPMQLAQLWIIQACPPVQIWRSLAFFLQNLGSFGLAMAYTGGVAHLCLRPELLRRMSPLGDVGRMSLTNYILQSVVCNLLFYSYGLRWYGQWSFAGTIPLIGIILAALVAFCRWWMRRFRFGPLEWLWRSLTYMHLQPLRR